MPSFDGTPLDVDLTLPVAPRGEGHPLIVLLHGFGNDKHEWQSTTDEADGTDKWHWNSHWFATHGFSTFVGIGYVDLPYLFAGQTGQVDARVWDVAPSGETLLVSRGTYRLDVPGFDAPEGTLRLPLFGNHWLLEAGHRVRLDLTQADQPFLRPSNPPSRITFTNPRLVLPTREVDTTVGGQ